MDTCKHQLHFRIKSSCVFLPLTSSRCFRFCSHCVCCCSSSPRYCSECLARLLMDCMSFSRPVQPTFTQTQTGLSFSHCWSVLVLGHIHPELLVITAKTQAIKVCYISYSLPC